MKRICVTGGCRAAGATFVATSLALLLAEKADGVTFVENPKVSNYKEEAAVLHQLSLDSVGPCGKTSFKHNINWIFGDNSPLQEDKKCRYIIYDSPLDYRNFDLIICIVDALPSKVMASQRSVDHLKNYFFNRTFWVLNRGQAKDVRPVEKYLGIKFDALIPMEIQEVFYLAEHHRRPLVKSKFISDGVRKSIEKIAEYIVHLY